MTPDSSHPHRVGAQLERQLEEDPHKREEDRVAEEPVREHVVYAA